MPMRSSTATIGTNISVVRLVGVVAGAAGVTATGAGGVLAACKGGPTGAGTTASATGGLTASAGVAAAVE
jgi:hypothetical protein